MIKLTLLSRLWEEDNLLNNVLNERTLKDKSRVTWLLGGLAEKSLIEKKVNEADKRMKYEILPIVIKLIDMSSSNIFQSDLEATIKTLKTIFTNINNVSKEKGDD